MSERAPRKFSPFLVEWFYNKITIFFFSCLLDVFCASAKAQVPCGRQRCRHRGGRGDESAERETQVREDELRLAENEKSLPGFAMREGDDDEVP